MGLGIWGNRAGKAGILVVVAGVVFATGYLANNGAATPQPVAESLPEPDLKPRVIKVAKGSIASRLVLDATVSAEPAVPVRPEKAGTVKKVLAKAGQRVGKGEAVVVIETTPEPPAVTDPKKKPKAPKPVTTYLRATAAGKIAELNAHVGSSVAPGEAAFSIDLGRFRAVAKVDSKNVYKLYNEPQSIKMKIDHGPAPFSCPLIAYGAGVGEKADKADPMAGPQQGGSEVEVTCRIPAHRKVFSGIPGKMSIVTAKASGVPVVPLGAVLGQAGNGLVTVVGEDGKHEKRKVKLGLNDGAVVEIRSGLEVGDKILDRAPEDPAFAGPPKQGQGNGPMYGPMEMQP